MYHPKRKKELLKQFGSVNKLIEACLVDLDYCLAKEVAYIVYVVLAKS